MPLKTPLIPALVGTLIITVSPLSAGVKLLVRDGRPLVDGVYVNGHGPYRFLVDTGANVNLIEKGLAVKIGMSPTFHVDLASAAGKTPLAGSDGNEISLESVKAGGQKFLFSDLEAVHQLDFGVRGILGQWFLAQFDYSIDIRNQKLAFGKQQNQGPRIPFTMRNGRAVIASSLGDLVLDSGAPSVILFGGKPDGPSDRVGKVRTVTGWRESGIASRELIIQGHSVWRGDSVTLRAGAEPGVDGLLPISLFKATYVCNSEGYLVLE